MAKKYFTDESLSALIDKIKTGDAESLSNAKSYVDTELVKKANSSHNHDDRYYTESEVDTKISGVSSTISSHTGNTTIHVTSGERTNWNSAYTHSTSTHAPSNAERNVIVGIQKNGIDLTVDSSTRKVNITVPTTAADIGAATNTHNHDGVYDTKGSAADALAEAKEYANTKTSGMATTTVVDNKISSHNTSTTAHSDIRVLITDLTTKLNNFLDVDDATSDQLSEVLELINNNKGTLESLTSSKVNISDIIDNLATANANKVLSANQGVAIKALIDALDTEVSGKADATHNHAIADISGLQSTLDEKAASFHTHTVSEISDLTATATELNYVDGVTSNIQTQLDEKATQQWVLENAGGVGKSLEGQTVSPISGTSVTAGVGAEIFNDYRDRTYGSNSAQTTGNVASGDYSHAEGRKTTASGYYSHVEGDETYASGMASHAEGLRTEATGMGSHAEGFATHATGKYSHAEGSNVYARGDYSHAEGYSSEAKASYSHAEGYDTIASGSYSHAAGYGTIANKYQCVVGRYNTDIAGPTSLTDTTESLFIVGIGTSDSSRSNGFRVRTDGKVYGVGTFGTTGADYAEYFEWLDGNPNNEDRRGHFVTLEGDKIRCATTNDDYILGVVSAEPSVSGDVHSENWHNKYLEDIFGSKIVDVVKVEETIDEDGEIIPAHIERQWVLNPDYNPDEKYISREERPEWAAIGIVGKLVVVDDGTCQVNGYCQPNTDGIATVSQEKTNYRVMERLDDTHIRIFIR